MRNINCRYKLFFRCGRALAVALVVPAILSTGYANFCLAQEVGQEDFRSPEEASHALFLAVQNHDEGAMMRVLGAGKELISTDDETEDKLAREQFMRKYEQMHRLVPDANGLMLLYVGAENWPFPTPLVSLHGRWHFDARAGMEEVLLRRIGENELSVLQVCHAHVGTQSAARPAPPYEYASVAALLDYLAYGAPAVAFQGYYFQRLESAGKKWVPAGSGAVGDGKITDRFAFVAFPAEYGSTGIVTFVVSRDGAVYEKDLGPSTTTSAAAMSEEHAIDATWHRIDEIDLPG
jgi:hypothetical protein